MSAPDLNPEIPDAISFSELSNYLSDKPHMPVSPVIPELNLGGPDGGICDLQFAIMQLIQRSDNGCNVLQLLSAAIHLMLEVELHFSEQIRRAEAELPPFDDAGEAERLDVARVLRGLTMSLKASSGLTEDLFSALMANFGSKRVQFVRDRITGVPTPSEFRSHLLISDELISGLQLDRASVTRYLDRASETL